MTDDLSKLLSGVTTTVPEAGKVLGLKSRNAAYEAARKGEIPSIRLGGRIVVPCAKLRQMLGMEPDMKAA